MASKICCCYTGEGASATVGSYNPSTCQQHYPRTFNLNADPHRNSMQKRHPHHRPDILALKACTLGRP
uniref:Testis expressed 53 n=1 Tax=Monodon monoceros TaxID=40151 RepID=A0A8C6FE77_MONMO